MLILTRRVGEALMIGKEITVTVLSVNGNQIRIGIKAPKDVVVHREEVYERINRLAVSMEHWQHVHGCRAWLLVRRNPSDGSVLDVRLLARTAVLPHERA